MKLWDCAVQYLGHALSGLGMRAAGRVRVDERTVDGLEKMHELRAQCILDVIVILSLGGRRNGGRKLDLAYGGDEGDDLDAKGLL